MNNFFTYIYLDPRKPGKYLYQDLSFDYQPIYVGKGHNKRDTDHLTHCYDNSNNYDWHFYRTLRKIFSLNLKPIVTRIKDCLSEEQALETEILTISKIGRLDEKTGPLLNKAPGGEGWLSSDVAEHNRNNWKIIKPDGSILFVRDLKIWCLENKINYSSCKTFSSRRTIYKGYCFNNIDRDGELSKVDFQEAKTGKTKKFRACVYELEFKNKQKMIINNLSEFYRKYKICRQVIDDSIKNNTYAHDLFKIKKIAETRISKEDTKFVDCEVLDKHLKEMQETIEMTDAIEMLKIKKNDF